MTEYQTVAGTEPNADEQHEARTVTRTDEDGRVYMMTEIEDGAFVQWGNCFKCMERIQACTCRTGPTAPPYIEKWRTERFDASFKGRRAAPALPELLKTRDRRIDAVIRLLRGKGWTLEPPADRPPLARPSSVFDKPEGNVYVVDDDSIVDEEHAARVEAYDIERGAMDPKEAEHLVGDGLDRAIEAAKQRAQEDNENVGF